MVIHGSAGGWASRRVGQAFSAGAGIPSVVPFRTSPDAFAVRDLALTCWNPSEWGTEQGGRCQPPLAFRGTVRVCSEPKRLPPAFCFFLKTPSEASSLPGCCWHLVERRGSGRRADATLAHTGVPARPHRVLQGSHGTPRLPRAWRPQQGKRGDGKLRLHPTRAAPTRRFSAPSHPAPSLYDTYLVFVPFTLLE